MIKMFLEEVRWGKLDYLFIDLLFGIGDVVLDIYMFILKCNEFIVIILYYVVVLVVFWVGYMVVKNNYKIIGVIENMFYFILVDG